jgi:hypothetical protein
VPSFIISKVRKARAPVRTFFAKSTREDEAMALVDEFSAAMEATIEKASRDMSLAIADILKSDPGAFFAGGTGPNELWDRLYRKPIENAWRVYATEIMAAAGANEFGRLFGSDVDPFDVKNPYATQYLESRGAELVRGIVDETRAGVRLAVREMITQGAGTAAVGDAVSQIADLVGLSERDTRAVLTRRDQLAEAGYADADIERESQRQVDRLLTRRGSTIARTEGIRAESQGVMASWKQAIDDELLPANATRKWIAEGGSGPHGVCPICIALEKLAPVGIDQPFYVPGEGPVWAPPAHPNCRCQLAIA